MSLIADAEVADLQFDAIPVVDLSVLSEQPSDRATASRRDLVAQMRDASMKVGFFYVKHHNVPEAVIERVLHAMQEYFARPLEKKMGLHAALVNDGIVKGYTPLHQDNKIGSNAGAGRDLHEAFEFGFRHSTEWPSTPDMQEFRASALAYHQAVVALGKQLFQLFAESLELPPEYFEDRTKLSVCHWKGLHYPPQDLAELKDEEERMLGIGAHTDWDCFTILWQQPGHQALQVRSPSGEWIDAPALPGMFVVNIAENLTRITNGIFKSTEHRVINKTDAERYSMPLFFGLDADVLLEPIPSCVSPERPFDFEVITAGENLQRKLAATYGGGRH